MENNQENRSGETSSNNFKCDQCHKAYKYKRDLNSHIRAVHRGIKFSCGKCGKEFNKASNKTRHETTCSFDQKTFICDTCGKQCATEGGLRRHQDIHLRRPLITVSKSKKSDKKRKSPNNSISTGIQTPGHSKIKISKKSPNEFRCRKCSDTFCNRRELYAHAMSRHYQVGEGLQPVPWRENSAPWEGEILDENLGDVYQVNAPIILQQHRLGPIQSAYNFPLDNSVSLQHINRLALEIYDQEQRAFKLNLAFGVILKNRETGEYRYYTPYANSNVLISPLYISRRTDLRRLYLRLRQMDITTELLRQRPNTKWVPVLVTNVLFTVFSTNYVLGVGSLPDHLKNHNAIVSLIKNPQTKRNYKDNLCAFRCLAYHKGFDVTGLERSTKVYFTQWNKYKKCEKYFAGVTLEEIPEFEKLFKINVEVYSLAESGECYCVYRSRGRFQDTMYLNLHENHLSYIKNFPGYAKKFRCETCDRHFHRANDLHVHQRTCSGKTKFIYPGRFYKPYETIFEKLDQFGIHVSNDQRYFEWFVCYDYEAMLQKVENEETKYLQWIQKHIPISVSICSNVEGYTIPFCIVEPEQDKLVESMVTAMREIAEKVRELADERWGWVLEEIKQNMNKKDERMDISNGDETEENDNDDELKELQQLYDRFEKYMSQVPVLGFNSANYDLNLIKKCLAKHLNLHDQKQTGFVVKKNNSYTCIACDQLKFLDISQFLAAGCSYAKFLKAYQVEEQKGFFPYEYLDDVSKLDGTELPGYEHFYSSLKQTNITKEEYNYCEQIWEENNMVTFRDFLIWYNNLDVKPFVTAVERLQEFYFKKGIDIFKTAISVPGIARQMLFQTAKQNNANFALFDRSNADLYQTVKHNVIGGPSIIFHRHHKAGETFIRGGSKKCHAILGFDANALYLECIGKPMPVGPFVRRLASNKFKPEVRDRFMAAIYWMDWLMLNDNSVILHQINHGSEIRVGKYLVDGFKHGENGINPTCYQFHGCYWHGHDCFMTKNVKDPEWRDNRENKLNKTKQITAYLNNKGYNVVEMWECDFRNYCKQHPEINDFIDAQRPGFFRKHKGKVVSEDDILNGVLNEELFGMVEVDIEIPDQWPEPLENPGDSFEVPDMSPFEYYQEMSPLFCTTEVPFDAIGEHMKEHVERYNLSKTPRRLLVGGIKGKQMLIATPLLKWYLDHKLKVTKIYQVVEFEAKRCFKEFVEDVSDARRSGDTDTDTAIIADTMKVIGNSSYGSMIMDKTKHMEMDYVQGENKTCLKINDPRFRKLECLDEEEQFYEAEMAKRIIKLDLPIQLGYFVLQYAKLRMLEFYYDFIDKFVERQDFEYCEMDTDSAYMAISGRTLEDVIKNDKMKEYQEMLKGFCTNADFEADAIRHWFPRTCCQNHAKYDKRTPGLFKLEYQGDEMIGLCSKTYIVRQRKFIRPSSVRIVANNLIRKAKGQTSKKLLKPRYTNEYKFSSKGISKRHIVAPMSIFRGVLKSKKSNSGINRGFRVRKNTIFTYSQERRGFSYFYCKRKVLEDGIRTVPLDIILCPLPAKESEDME